MPMDLYEALERISHLENAVLSWQSAYEGMLAQFESLSAYVAAQPNLTLPWTDDVEPVPPGEEIPEAEPVDPAWYALVGSIWAYEKRTN